MLNNTFLKNLSQLSSKDFKEFFKYSISLYNDKSAANELLKYFKKYHPNFERHELEERYAFNKIYPNQTFKKIKLSNAISDLRGRFKEFLLWKKLKEPSFETDFLLLKTLEHYNLETLAKKQFKKIETSLSNKIEPDIWAWMNKLRLAHENYFNLNIEKVDNQIPKIEDVMNQLDAFYGIAKLQYSCEILARKQILNEEITEIRFLQEIKKENWSQFSFLHTCYQSALQLIENGTDENYFLLKKQVIKNLISLKQRDRHVLITYLTNYAASKIREGNQNFAPELFDLYKQGIAFEAFIVDGYFHDMHFGNIVDFGCRFKQYKWSEQFIETWGPRLAENIRNEVITFSKAFIFYETKKYDLAFELLQNDFNKNLFYAVRAKWLELVCLYELDFSQTLIADKCKAFNKFIRRSNLINESLGKGMLNFIKIFLLLLEPNGKKEKLLESLEKVKYIAYKSWLVEKIEEKK